jgi:hypothetical protein
MLLIAALMFFGYVEAYYRGWINGSQSLSRLLARWTELNESEALRIQDVMKENPAEAVQELLNLIKSNNEFGMKLAKLVKSKVG